MLRRIAATPLFTGLVILTLAPGIGAHVAIFSLVNVLFLQPLPAIEDAGRLVGLYQKREGSGYHPLSLPDYADYREASTVFRALAAHYPTAPLSLTNGDETAEVNGSVVTANYFPVLGVEPALGRFFLPEEDAPGAGPAVVLSHKLWRSRFGGRPDVVGQVVTLNNTPSTVVVAGDESYEVVGVVPDVGYRTFNEPVAAQVYLPYWQDAENVDARLCLRADGDLAQLLPAVRRELGAIDPNVPVAEVEPLTSSLDRYFASVRTAGRVLGASAVLALLLSTVGLYGMLSLAVAQRTRDIGIRMAIGASRSQAVALVVRDATILVAFALALGLGAALAASRLLAHYLYGVSPRDPLTFAVTLALLALSATLASWVPARRASRIDPLVAIRQG